MIYLLVDLPAGVHIAREFKKLALDNLSVIGFCDSVFNATSEQYPIVRCMLPVRDGADLALHRFLITEVKPTDSVVVFTSDNLISTMCQLGPEGTFHFDGFGAKKPNLSLPVVPKCFSQVDLCRQHLSRLLRGVPQESDAKEVRPGVKMLRQGDDFMFLRADPKRIPFPLDPPQPARPPPAKPKNPEVDFPFGQKDFDALFDAMPEDRPRGPKRIFQRWSSMVAIVRFFDFDSSSWKYRVLVGVHRGTVSGRTYLVFPSRIPDGETIQSAATRALFEETGLSVQVSGNGDFKYQDADTEPAPGGFTLNERDYTCFFAMIPQSALVDFKDKRIGPSSPSWKFLSFNEALALAESLENWEFMRVLSSAHASVVRLGDS